MAKTEEARANQSENARRASLKSLIYFTLIIFVLIALVIAAGPIRRYFLG